MRLFLGEIKIFLKKKKKKGLGERVYQMGPTTFIITFL
jgi:hypothetical protein